MPFRFIVVTPQPTELPGLVDGQTYAGQNSPADIESVDQAAIFYTRLADADPAPPPNSPLRAVILPFATGQFDATAGERFWIWTPEGVAHLVLVDRH